MKPSWIAWWVIENAPEITAWLAMNVAAVASSTSGRRSISGARKKKGFLMASAAPASPSGFKPWEHTGLDFETLTTEVSRCMNAGLLRVGDPHAVAFLMYAGISYEPMLYNLMCRLPIELDAVAILRSVFHPLTTALGASALNDRLADIARSITPDDAPATLHAFMHYQAQTEARQSALTASVKDLRVAAATYLSSRKPGRPGRL